MHNQATPFEPSSDEAPSFVLPETTRLFAERAARFEHLATGHQLADWLRFLGQLSQGQHQALTQLPTLSLPDQEALRLAHTHHMPPLSATTLARPASWRDVLKGLALELAKHAPDATRTALQALTEASDEQLECLAERLLVGEPQPEDAVVLPFVAAALQVVWTALASRLPPAQLQILDAQGVCPCCGSLPTISVLRSFGSIENLRYLHCSLCNTEWNVPRATCTACGSDKSVALQEIEGSKGLVRAETCEECQSYLKILYPEKDPQTDPIADDLASLALDLLVDEAGYGRSGPNLLLLANTVD